MRACAQVLSKNADNAKARFTRGKAHARLNELVRAEADRTAAARLSPEGPWSPPPPRARALPRADAHPNGARGLLSLSLSLSHARACTFVADGLVRAELTAVQGRQRLAEALSRAQLTGFLK